MIRRKYENESDQRQIRQFLQEVYLLNDRREFSWPVGRWDYWLWHINANLFHFDLSAAVFLWQDERGQIAGVLNPDNPGEACLQVHPDLETAELEVEMISTAETQYAVTQPGGSQKLTIWCPASYSLRQDILTRRGYTRLPEREYQRRRDRSLPALEAPLAAGYSLRALGGPEELPARSWVSWKAFHPTEPDSKYEGWEWYCNVQQAPLYRRDLDLVAVSPQGELAAFCTVWYDDVTQSAMFEPVGAHPDHRRRGLSKALLAEALYASAGFTEYDLSDPWTKEW
jgi:hypothetical protein